MTKEIKHFFTENNYLNKGSAPIYSQNVQKVRQEFNDLMPAPDVLQAYEEIMPGTVAKIIDLMQQEQKNKHALEQSKIVMRARAELIGRLFSVLLLLVIGYITLSLAQYSLNYAIIFAAIAFSSIFSISLMSYCKSWNKNNNGKTKAVFVESEKLAAEEVENVKPSFPKVRDQYRKPIYKKKRS